MSRKLEDIFNECYERILQGENITSCLTRYPEYAAELEPMLRTALGFTWRASSLQPRPEFKYWARVRLQGAQTYASQQKQSSGFFVWRQAWAIALAALLVFLLTGGTVIASSDALPDQPLYPVKLATEQARLAFAFSAASKAEIYAQLAETRTLEIEAMARRGKTEQLTITATRLVNQLEQANCAIAKVESTKVATAPSTGTPEKTAPVAPPVTTARETTKAASAERFRESLEVSTSRSLTALEKALEQAPPQAQPALKQAIEAIHKAGYKRAPQKPSGMDNKNYDNDGQPLLEPEDSRSRPQEGDAGKGKIKSVPVEPEQSQPLPLHEDNDKIEPTPPPIKPDSSGSSTESGVSRTTVQPNHKQLSPKQSTETLRNTDASK